jgi:hypothetical protein
LGNSLTEVNWGGSQQESELTKFRQSEIMERNATEPGAMPYVESVVFKGGSNYAAKQIQMDEFLSSIGSDPTAPTESQLAYRDASGAGIGSAGGGARPLSPRVRWDDNRGLLNAAEKRMNPDYYSTYPSQKPGQVYAPHLTLGDVGDYLSAGAEAAGKKFVNFFTDDLPALGSKIVDTISDPFNAHPLDALEKGGLQLQDKARQAMLAARAGNYRPVGELQGEFVGSSAAGTAFGVGTGAVVGKTVDTINGIRLANQIAAAEAYEVNLARVANNYGADGGYIPPTISIFGVPGGVGRLSDYAHPYLYTGHIGYSFDYGNVIYGHGPYATGDIPVVIDSLKNGAVYAGKVTDDTDFFKMAAQSTATARKGLGDQMVYKLDMPVTRGQYELAQQLTQSRGLYTPLPEFTYSWKTGGACMAPYNCATYPSSLGLPIPINSDAVSKYVPAMINQGAIPWKR